MWKGLRVKRGRSWQSADWRPEAPAQPRGSKGELGTWPLRAPKAILRPCFWPSMRGLDTSLHRDGTPATVLDHGEGGANPVTLKVKELTETAKDEDRS